MRLLQDYEFDFVGGGCASDPTCLCAGQGFALDPADDPCSIPGAESADVVITKTTTNRSGLMAKIGGFFKKLIGGEVEAGAKTETTTTTTTTVSIDCDSIDSDSSSDGDGDGGDSD